MINITKKKRLDVYFLIFNLTDHITYSILHFLDFLKIKTNILSYIHFKNCISLKLNNEFIFR